MAHKLLSEDINERKTTHKVFTLPKFEGKFGFSIFVGGKELFIGVCVAEVEIERIVKKKLYKTPKAGVRIFQLD